MAVKMSSVGERHDCVEFVEWMDPNSGQEESNLKEANALSAI